MENEVGKKSNLFNFSSYYEIPFPIQKMVLKMCLICVLFYLFLQDMVAIPDTRFGNNFGQIRN